MQKACRRYEFEEKKKLRDTPATLPPKISFKTTSAASGAIKNVDMYVPWDLGRHEPRACVAPVLILTVYVKVY